MSVSGARAGVIPASLSFFAIYNPSLSSSDEDVQEQIVYFYSREKRARKPPLKDGGAAQGGAATDDINERLRQVGLAQGMVQFARDFSRNEPIESIDTEKSRIVLHNLEGNWWLLASVDFTKILRLSESSAKGDSDSAASPFEYSAREVAPPALLLQQILRAHGIFLLHQSGSLQDLWTKTSRPKFCSFLKRFWDNFIRTWDVLLHGNPAVDVYNGLKLSAGGELGIGAEEQEWGSGEREVLEGFVARTDGLVDLVVSRFGDIPDLAENLTKGANSKTCGSGEYPQPSDGVIFSGIGTLSRSTVRDISSWMEWLSMYGEHAFGARESPTSVIRRKRNGLVVRPEGETNEQESVVNIPPPIIREAGAPLKPSSTIPSRNGSEVASKDSTNEPYATGTDTIIKYLTLGVYGSNWGISSGRPVAAQQVSNSKGSDKSPALKSNTADYGTDMSNESLSAGHFLIGLTGDLEGDEMTDDGGDHADDPDTTEPQSRDGRIVVRTLYVERRRKRRSSTSPPHETVQESQEEEITLDRLRVIVYVQAPFIFTLLFETETYALAMSSFYRSLHHQLGPLRGPLQTTTSPHRARERLAGTVTKPRSASTASASTSKTPPPIHDLVYDPARQTLHTTIPNIPEAATAGSAPTADVTTGAATAPWTRAEAMTVHSQILATHTATRRAAGQWEQTCKTSRGWWVVWMRLPPSISSSHLDASATMAGEGNFHPSTNTSNNNNNRTRTSYREAFLVRKASDYVAPSSSQASKTGVGAFGRFRGLRRGGGGGGGGSRAPTPGDGGGGGGGWAANRLAEGIGVDARQYIESLLSLSR